MNPRESRSAMFALTLRELLRFARQPSRVLASLATPALVWLFAGSGLAGSFVLPGDTNAAVPYAAYLIPGMATMVVVFGAVFASISLIQDRQAGFLQSVLVSPVPSWAIAASKILGAVILSVTQGVVVLLAAPLVGVHPGFFGYACAMLGLILAAIFVSALSLTLAWRMNSVAGFHGVMNLLLLPMWLLSGAMFPLEGAAHWLRWIIWLNPLAWTTRIIGAAMGTSDVGFFEWFAALAAAAGAFMLARIVIGTRSVRPGSQEIA